MFAAPINLAEIASRCGGGAPIVAQTAFIARHQPSSLYGRSILATVSY